MKYKLILSFIAKEWFKILTVIILATGVYYIGIRPSHIVKVCRGDAYSISVSKMQSCLVKQGYPIEVQINI